MNNTVNKDIILVVDDQPNNLKVISSLLRDEYMLSFAQSGIKALEILEKMKPTLILLDIMMPEMDGYEVIDKIKSNHELKEIPVIFLTAKSDIGDVIKGFDHGAVDYITKPFNLREVQSRIKNHISLFNAKETILNQKKEIEEKICELNETKEELEKRNEDLTLAHHAVEEHANKVNNLNNALLKSEYLLKNANKKLMSTIEERDKFFSIIAHDLRSPFNGFLGLLEMLNEDKGIEDKDKEEIISSLYESASGIYELLENLLNWSRVQRDSIEYSPRQILIYDVIESNIKLHKSKLIEKSIKLINNVDKDISINADKIMTCTIFRNLISNSIKFSYEDSEVIISSKIDAKRVKISVQDSGIGIEEEKLEQLFKLGDKVSTKGTKGEPGTGLGLILTKEFLEIHNGSIYVESELGKGSTFTVELPFK